MREKNKTKYETQLSFFCTSVFFLKAESIKPFPELICFSLGSFSGKEFLVTFFVFFVVDTIKKNIMLGLV